MSLLRQVVAASNGHPVSQAAIQEQASQRDVIKCDAVWSNASNGYQPRTNLASAESNGIVPNLIANIAILIIAVIAFNLVKRRVFNQQNPSRTPLTTNTTRSPVRVQSRPSAVSNLIYGQSANGPAPTDSDDDYRRRKWYQWITHLLSESDYLLLTRGGLGALEYVRFQRYVLGMTVLICIMSVCILLPVDLGGNLLSDTIGTTTIFNVPTNSFRLWFPVWFTLILFPLGLVAMTSFGYKIPLSDRPAEGDTKTVLISGLPATRANTGILREHFRQAYPRFEVTDLTLSYDVSKLNQLENELRQAESALDYIASRPAGSPDTMVSRGLFKGNVDALKYYAWRKSQLQQQIDNESRRWRRINPVFFVTMATDRQAQRVYDDHQPCPRLCQSKPSESVYSNDVQSRNWRAFYAPDPSNINWENLSSSGFMWYLRAAAVVLVVLVIIGLAATVVIVLNFSGLQRLQRLYDNPAVSQISPAIVMFFMQKVLPEIIMQGVQWMRFWTRPKQIIAEMRLIFVNLLLAILIVPSFGLTGTMAAYFGTNPAIRPTRRECISLPDNGSLYINFLIFAAFTATAFSLFRINLLLSYLVRRWRAKSEAEAVLAGQVNSPFSYGEEYANFLTVFAVTVMFALISPLVSLFGMIALTMKYFLDQYMLCNVYKRASIPNSVHAVAISQFFSTLILQLVFICLIFVLRNGADAKTTVLVLALVTYGSIYVAMTFFGLCRKVSLFELLNNGQGEFPEGPRDLADTRYLPPSLVRLDRQLDAQNQIDQPQI